jgi:tetratricopeptide (TPR) repeat protein
MPGHLYLQLGRYTEAIRAAEQAIRADAQLLEEPGAVRHGTYASGYAAHHHYFLSYALAMTGRSHAAIAAAREAAKRSNAAESAPWLDAALPSVPLTLVTFGRWAEVLAEPDPDEAHPHAVGMTWYARGVAHAALGDVASARRAVTALQGLASGHPRGDTGTLLQIALHSLHGEISMRARRSADTTLPAREELRLAEDAVKHFAEAARLESALTFNEPPLWYYPVRHSLGLALLAAHRPAEAERAYREDLRANPDNGWALFGLAQSLTAQGMSNEAEQVMRTFRVAWKHADVTLSASRF